MAWASTDALESVHPPVRAGTVTRFPFFVASIIPHRKAAVLRYGETQMNFPSCSGKSPPLPRAASWPCAGASTGMPSTTPEETP